MPAGTMPRALGDRSREPARPRRWQMCSGVLLLFVASAIASAGPADAVRAIGCPLAVAHVAGHPGPHECHPVAHGDALAVPAAENRRDGENSASSGIAVSTNHGPQPLPRISTVIVPLLPDQAEDASATYLTTLRLRI